MFISGLGEWVKLRRAISRVTEGSEAEFVLSLQLADASEPRGPDREETSFTKEVEAKAKELEKAYGAHVRLHLHPHEASLTIQMSLPEDFEETVKSISTSLTQCEECAAVTLQGEIHTDKKLSILFYGDLYKLVAIYPHETGKYLEVLELNL